MLLVRFPLKRPTKENRFLINVFAFFLALFILLLFIPVFTYAYFASDLKNKETLMNKNDRGVTLLDRNDKPFFTFYGAKKESFVTLDKIPKQMQKAVIAVEDKDFYSHPGFSVKAVARSFFENLKSNQLAYGGSTITQQLVKNSLLNQKKSFLRKYQEIILAYEVERRFSKQEILEMYLNSVYFGRNSFGVEEAAKAYFGKAVSELDLAQESYLAGLLPAPSQLSEEGDSGEAKIRHEYVLQKMQEQNFASTALVAQAKAEPLKFVSSAEIINSTAPHFALMVRDELIKRFGGEENVARLGYKVKTTLNLDFQQYAEKIIQEQVERLSPDRVSNGAVVVMDPKTGEILALVGSKDWYDNKFGKVNVTIMFRQPGSSFKPIIYSRALERRYITPVTTLHDQPTTFEGNYKPKDFDGKYRGNVTVRRALSNSLNIPSVEVMSKVGVEDAVATAQRFGLTTIEDPSNYGLSLVLGAGEIKLTEMTNVYATFANHGEQNPITTILEIKDKENQEVYSYHHSSKKIIDPQVAFLISSILSDNKARAEEFGNALTISRTAAVKTGTTENFKDSLTFGYTPSLTIGVWVGNNDGTPMDNIAGSLGAAPIWKALMEKFLDGTKVESFAVPAGIVTNSFCFGDSKTATPSAQTEYFIEGTQPKSSCSFPNPTPAPPPTPPTPAPPPAASQSPTPNQGTSLPLPTPSVNKLGSEGKGHLKF